MRLFELSNTSYPYRFIEHPSYGQEAYEFVTVTGFKYYVFFQEYGNTVIQIEFELDNPPATHKSRIKVTGTGDQFKILSTIKEIINHHLSSIDLNKTEQILFDSDLAEPSRIKLYDKFVPIMLSILGPSWLFDHDQRRHSENGTVRVEYIFRNTGKL